MGKTLVIVESPTKSKAIQGYLGNDYIVKASMGHVRDLPVKELGIDTQKGFNPHYIVPSDKKDIVDQLKKIAKSANKILLASDPDREGEAIAWHLEKLLKPSCNNIQRVTFQEINKNEVNKSVQSPRSIDVPLVDAQQARRVLDRLVGYKISPWLSTILGSYGLSAGRVQSVALQIIVHRKKEIDNFVPKEYWKIYVDLSSQVTLENTLFELSKYDGNELEIKEQAHASQIETELSLISSFQVSQVTRKPKNTNPKSPFTTSLLIQDASNKLKFDSQKTMMIAQQLFEGINIGSDGHVGLITYMRSDSVRISPEFQEPTIDYIRKEFGDKYAPSKPNVYKSKGDNVQDAHEAIRPTSYSRTPKSIQSYLNPDQYKLYELIYTRYIASQMAPAVYDTQSVLVSAEKYELKANGRSLLFDGFLKVYKPEDGKKKDEENLMPSLKKGEELLLNKIEKKQKFTTPPPKYTEASLVKTLEENGVGRPSTYQTIFSVLKKRNYVTVTDQKFDPTELGVTVSDTLEGNFSDLINVEFTSNMESKLDEIADAKNTYLNVLEDFYKALEIELSKFATNQNGNINTSLSNKTYHNNPCPKCGSKMVLLTTPKGKFYGCENYPTCNSTLPFIEENAPKCPKCNKPMVKRQGKTGSFYGCSGYPTCNGMIGTSLSKDKGGTKEKKRSNCGCGGEINETTKMYHCNKCFKVIFKNGLSKLGKKEITYKEAVDLMNGKIISVKLFSSTKNKSYDGKAKYNGELERVEVQFK